MPRLLLLLPTTTYRTKAFIDAALKLGFDIVAASEKPSTMAATNPAGLLTLNFLEPEKAGRAAAEFAHQFPIDAVIPVDEDTAVVAASIARALKLEHNSEESVRAAKNKFLMREALHKAGVRVPRYRSFSLDDDLQEIGKQLSYPCVVKPVFLSTSRGVMRADNEAEFVRAVERLERIVEKKDIARRGGAAARQALAEEFIPGEEVAVEGLVSNGPCACLRSSISPTRWTGRFLKRRST